MNILIHHSKKCFSHLQFGLFSKHSSIHQIHKVVNTISSSLENKQYCTSVFLDVSQSFNRVLHEGLIYKLWIMSITKPYYRLLKIQL